MVFSGSVMVDASLMPIGSMFSFLVIVPSIYITAVIVYTSRRAHTEKNPFEKRRHLFVGLFPLLVIVGGVIQLLALPETPIFCFCCTILMLIFYIQSMEGQISIDPLTRLNNRGQLLHYLTQESGGHRDGRLSYVIMLDINDFKKINDTYGHNCGDYTLQKLSELFSTRAADKYFVSRWGGEEFCFFFPDVNIDEAGRIITDLLIEVRRMELEYEGHRFSITFTAGVEENDYRSPLSELIESADRKLYLGKQNGRDQIVF